MSTLFKSHHRSQRQTYLSFLTWLPCFLRFVQPDTATSVTSVNKSCLFVVSHLDRAEGQEERGEILRGATVSLHTYEGPSAS